VILNDGESTTTISRVVLAGESTVQLMSSLAALINTRAPASFSATTEGAMLVIVNRLGQSFTTTVEVTTLGTVSVLESAQRKRPEPGNDYFYGPVNLNIRVNEGEQVDVMNIFHGNSPSNDYGVLTNSTLTGLGMGDNVVIAGREIAGGITYFDLEVLNLQLGTGNDHFIVESTHEGATNIFAGAGDDHVEVITTSGHASVQTQAGADTIDVFNADQLVDQINGLLTINGGGERTDTLTEIAAALAEKINALQGNFTATTNGSAITITNIVDTFEAQFVITPAGAAATSATATPLSGANSVTFTLNGSPSAGEIWTISTSLGSQFNYTVRAGDVLNINDSGDTNGNVGTVTGNTLIGLDMPTVSEVQTIFIQAASGTYKLLISDDHIDATTATTTLVTLNAEPLAGDTWTLNINLLSYSVVVGNSYFINGILTLVDQPGEIAAVFAQAINGDNNAANFTAAADGATILIVNLAGAEFDTTLTVTPLAGTAGGAFTIVQTGTSATVSLTGTPVANEIWRVAVTIGGVTRTYDYTVTGGVSLNAIATALAGLVNADLGVAGITATAIGTNLQIVKSSPGIFRAAFEIRPYTLTTNATTASVVLSGMPVSGDTWRVSIDGRPYSVVASTTLDTLAEIAAALVTAINNDNVGAAANFSAAVDGNVLVIVNRAGATFTTLFGIELAGGGVPGVLTVAATVPKTAVVTFGGTPLTGDLWTLTVAGTPYSVTIGNDYLIDGISTTVNTLSELAAALAEAINVDVGAANFTVSAHDNVLVIVNRTGTAFVTSAVLTPADTTTSSAAVNASTARSTTTLLSGQAVENQLWRLRLTIGQVTTNYDYVVENGDTLADIAAGLAGMVNAATAGDFVAQADGQNLVVTNLAGSIFSTGFQLFLANATSGNFTVNPTVPTTTVATLGGTPVLGEVWTIKVDAGTESVHSHRVGATGTSVSFTLTGAPLNGEVWTVVLNNNTATTYEVVIGDEYMLAGVETVIDELPEIAALLRQFINDDADAPTFTAVSEGTTLEISSTASFRMTYEIVPVGSRTDGAMILNSVVGALDSLADVTTALAADINANAATDFTATTEGSTLVIVNRAGTVFSTEFELTLVSGELGGAMVIDGSTALTTRVDLGGTPVTDETWTLTLDALTYEVVIGDSYDIDGVPTIVDTLVEIATALAQTINDDAAAADFTATASGATLLIVNRLGTNFVAEMDVTTTTTPATATNGTAAMVTLGGAPIINDTWTLTLTPSGGSATDVSFKVGLTGTLLTLIGVPKLGEVWTVALNSAGATTYDITIGNTYSIGGVMTVVDELAEVAAALSQVINDDADAADFTATNDGATVLIVDTVAPVTFTTTTQVTASPDTDLVRDGVIAIGSVDTLANIATALAAAINAHADLAEFSATVEGNALVIVNRNNVAFTTSMNIAPVGGTASGSATVATIATTNLVTLTGIPAAGEIWTLNLGGALVFNYTVGSGNALATVASAFASAVNASSTAADYTAIASGANIAIVNRLGTAFTPAVTIQAVNAIALMPVSATVTLGGVAEIDGVWTVTVAGTPYAYTVKRSASVLLSGTPTIDEAWQITVEGATYSHTVLAGQSLATIASALTTSFNAAPVANLSASTDGTRIYIVSSTGAAFTTTAGITPVGTTVGDMSVTTGDTFSDISRGLAKLINQAVTSFVATAQAERLIIANTTATTFTTAFNITTAQGAYSISPAAYAHSTQTTLSGSPVLGETWRVTLLSGGVTTTFTQLVTASIDTLAEIAAGLATAINTSAADSFSAVAEGASLTVVNRTGGAFTATLDTIASGRFDIVVTTVGSLNAVEATAAGIPVNGETWNFRLTIPAPGGSTTLTYPIIINGVTDTLAEIADALAQAINAAVTNFSATVEDGTTVVIVDNTLGQVFSASYSVTPVAAPVVLASTVSTKSVALALTGSPVAGETWTVTLGGTPYSYVTTSPTPTLADIALALASVINTTAPAAFTATARGNVLVVINTAENFTSSTSVTPVDGYQLNTPAASTEVLATLTGTPLAGQIWSLTLDGTAYPYTVTAGQDRSAIAAGLAAVVNASVASGFVAAAEGEVIVVVKLAGGAITASVSSTAASMAVIITTATARTATLSGTPYAGEIWSVTFDGRAYSVLVPNSMTTSGVASTLASLINGDNWSAVVSLSGTPSVGGIWTATVGGINYAVTVDATIDALSEIATALAAAINTDADTAGPDELQVDFKAEAEAGVLYIGTKSGATVAVTFNISAGGTYTLKSPVQFTAIADGSTLVIVNRAGASFSPTFAVVPSGNGVTDATTPKTATAQLVGTPIEGEVWYLLLTVNGQIHSFSHTVVSSGGVTETLADIASALASELNASAPSGFVITTEGDSLIVISTEGAAFTLGYEIGRADGTTVGAGAVDDSTATSLTTTLSGAPTEGEVWSLVLEIGGQLIHVTHVVALVDADNDPLTLPTLETLTDIARGLAEAINEIAVGDFVATTEGATLIIVSLDGTEFTAETDIIPARPLSGTGSVNVIENATKIASLGGTPRVDGVWNVVLTIGGMTRTFSYTVGSGEGLAAIAAGLAAALNAEADSSIVATAEGLSLIVTDRLGRPFQVSVQALAPQFSVVDEGTANTTTVELSGTPVTGEVWVITIDDQFYSVLIGSPAESLAQVAALFAAAINGDADAADFTAWADGEKLVISNRVGDEFVTTLVAQNVTRLAGSAFTTLDYSFTDGYTFTVADMQARLRILYGFDGIIVEEQRGLGNVFYTITFIGEQSGVDFDEIDWGESRTDTGLIPSPNASVEVIIRTVRNGSHDAELNNVQTVTINDATGGTFRLSFLLENEDGELVEVWTDPIAYNASALDLFKALSQVLNPNGATIDIDPEFDRVTRIPSRPFTDNVAVSKHDKVFQITFQGAYEDLQINEIDTTQLLGPARIATITFSGVTTGAATVDTAAATTATVALSGSPTIDDVWKVMLTLGGNTTAFQHKVATGETLTKIATALASEINARAGAGFVATSDGSTLVIVSLTGEAFGVTFDVTGSGSGSVGMTATTTVVDLSGAALAQEIWSVTVNGTTVNHTVSLVDADGDPETLETRPQTPAEIAVKLAKLINDDAALSGFVATTEGSALLITRLSGVAFTTAFQITPAGLPKTGDAWTVTLNNGASTQYSYTVLLGDTPSDIAQGLADQINTFGIPEYSARTEGNVLIIDDVAGNNFTATFALVPALGSTATAVTEHATATVATRESGFNYYGIKILNLDLGSGDDVINVQGTSAITNLNLGDGDERIYVSSTANFDLDTTTDFLRGHLNDVDGMLNINAGAGRHLLLISDESATIGDDNVLVTDTFATAAARSEAHPSVTGEALLTTEIYIFDLAQGSITFKADAAANFAEGITIWSGFGADTIKIDGTHYRNQLDGSDVIRTVTTLNTGLGNDHITVDLDAGEDDFFVLNTQGPYDLFLAMTDNDTVVASSTAIGNVFDSTLPLIVFGGQGDDAITTGSANDIVFGDRGEIWYYDEVGTLVTHLGNGGPGDLTDGVVRAPVRIFTVDSLIGGNDNITTNNGQDIVLGGINNDTVNVGEGNNIVLGDGGFIDYVTDDDDRTDIDRIWTTEADHGGNDNITSGSGDDIIIAGEDGEVVVNDQVYSPANVTRKVVADLTDGDVVVAGNGQNLVFGDNGLITSAVSDLNRFGNQPITLGLVEAIESLIGGSDNITTGSGNDIVVGGIDADTINAGDGQNIVLGDSGYIDWTAAEIARVYADGTTALPGTLAGDDENAADIDRIWTVAPDHGGKDNITTGSGDDIIIAGEDGEIVVDAIVDGSTHVARYVIPAFDGDVVYAGDGRNLVFGDNGNISASAEDAPRFGAQAITLGEVASITPLIGGSDTIVTGIGADIIIGGIDADGIVANYGEDVTNPINPLRPDGNNIVIGDSGVIDWAALERVDGLAGDDFDAADIDRIWSIAPDHGGNDTITTGAGNDIVIGGEDGELVIDAIIDGSTAIAQFVQTDITNGDVIRTGAGFNIVFGDSGEISAAATDAPQFGTQPMTLGLITTIAPALGGNDSITTGVGKDIIIGGDLDDIIVANDGQTASLLDNDNIILGDNGFIDYVLAEHDPANPIGDTNPANIDWISTTNPNIGGVDNITSGAGYDLIFGGTAGDTIYAGAGNDLVFGDHGMAEAATIATRVQLTGTASDGSVWQIQLIVGAVTHTYVYTVPNNANPARTLSDVARALANAINTDLTSDFMVNTDGAALVVVPLSGQPFSTTLNGVSVAAQVVANRGVIARALPLSDAKLMDPFIFTAIDTQNSDINAAHTTDGGNDFIYGEDGEDILLGQQGDDVIYAGNGDDDIVGGHNVQAGHDGSDRIDGGFGNDVIAGDNARVLRRGDSLSPRLRVLGTSGLIYDLSDVPQITGDPQVNPKGVAERDVVLFDHSFTPLADTSDADYIAGGAGDDVIFGQLGDDTIQGDGSVGVNPANDVFAHRLTNLAVTDPLYDTLVMLGSVEATTDGDDYIEGNGDQDTIFGNLGQDDIIGGSSNLFGLWDASNAVADRAYRPDADDMIFGGAGTRIARNDSGMAVVADGIVTEQANGHSRDADMALGDNGNIFRLVGVTLANGSVQIAPATGANTVGNGIATFGGYLKFNYDNYPVNALLPIRIIARAALLLDYTLGGSDYTGEATALGLSKPAIDIGAADEIHGEAGDDFLYGMVGNDVLFGDGQDDDLIGGYGADWITGGMGNDGVLGDDGRIYTSRNGTAEPLYGIAATTQQDISTPGKIQQATINVDQQLKKTVNLTPFNLQPTAPGAIQDPLFVPLYANDIIFGGLGNDALHGGSGDDAISGNEALLQYYSKPINGYIDPVLSVLVAGNYLRWGLDRIGEFAAYDEYNPLTKVWVDPANGNIFTDSTSPNAVPFILNFLDAEIDGDDVIFGDLGNDWLVAGRGRDHVYGGWGDDLLNGDDLHDTAGGLNNVPETDPTYEDIAYGGAGRDILIGNTGGDRLIDWVGEFNSYLVPFAPYGAAAISRALQPQLMDYLYMLSKSDGADPTRSIDLVNFNPTRNGEPYGELGLVNQQDFAWQEQTGAPTDPQAGNVPGGPRDVLRSATFSTGTAEGFAADSGQWTVSSGRLEVAPTSVGKDAVSVFYVDALKPNYYEIQATINAWKPLAGYKANAYLIFDYQSPTDFKFVGVNVSTNKMEMGERTANGWTVKVQSNGQFKSDTDYNMLLTINGLTATLIVNNKNVFSYAYQARIIEGVSYGLNTGMVGIGANNSRARIDNVSVQVLPRPIAFQNFEDFSDGRADIFTASTIGSWNISGGRDAGVASGGYDFAVSTFSLGVSAPYRLQLDAVLSTQGSGGIVFDYYNAKNFKFAMILSGTNQVVIGHRTKKGWYIDTAVSRTITAGVDYQLSVSLVGTTVSVSLGGAPVVGYVYNSLVNDGQAGMFARTGLSSFNSITVKSEDPTAGL
jgi:Ca2+-binding RTX toxin-like protein